MQGLRRLKYVPAPHAPTSKQKRTPPLVKKNKNRQKDRAGCACNVCLLLFSVTNICTTAVHILVCATYISCTRSPFKTWCVSSLPQVTQDHCMRKKRGSVSYFLWAVLYLLVFRTNHLAHSSLLHWSQLERATTDFQ